MSWEMVRLRDVGVIYTGSTPKTNDDTLFNGEYPFVTPGDLIGSVPIEKTDRTLSYKGVQVSTLLPIGSVLVCCIGSLGKIGIAGKNLVTNQQINAIVFNPEKVDYRYGYYACSGLKKELDTIAPATTVPIINKSRFSELKIPLPPISEQKRIAAILDKADEIRRKREQAIAKLEQLAQSIFVEMFGDDKLEYATIKSVTHKGNVVNTDISNDVWNLTLDQIESKTGKINALETINRNKLGSSTYYFSPPVVLYSKLRPYLNKVATPLKSGYATTELIPLYCDDGIINPIFLATYLRSDKFVNFADTNSAGAKMPRVIMDKFWGHKIPLPPISLQEEFAKRINQIEKLKADNTTALANHNALFASLQQQAFSGNL